MPTIAEVRAKFPQYQDMSDTELAGALHAKFYPDMPADVFAEKIGLAPPEPVSVNNVARSFATGVPVVGGLLNKANAATNAALAPVLNPLFDKENQLQGESFGERYANSLEMQNAGDAKFAEQHPIVDTGAKLAGATAALVPAVTAAPTLFGAAGGLGTRVAAGGASNAILGGTDAAVRGADPITGAIVGGALGAGLPVVGAVAKSVASPFISNILARINPEAYAQRQVARAVMESGRPTSAIAQDVVDAANEGQGVFTLADALGNSGQRMLSTVARAPGEGRTNVVNVLEGRQGTQGRRITNALAEGFEAPETAAQTEARLTAARDTRADAAYGAVRNDARPVDLTDAIAHADETLSPGVNQIARPQSGIANDSAEAALQHFRDRLTDGRSMLTDFTAVQRVRGDLSDAVQKATRAGEGNKARLLGGLLRRVDQAMEGASEGHLAANREFAQASRNIEAVQAGRAAARGGRSEDVIPRYQALPPEGQGAFRSGYVDPLIETAQSSPFGVNKARPLLNDAFQAEAQAMAPGNPLMQRRIGREQTMFETRNQALGNSKTAENLADADAMGIDPTVVGHLLAGNWSGAARSMIQAGSSALTGNTAQVRKAVSDILLLRGVSVTPARLDQIVGETMRQMKMLQDIARRGTATAAGAATITANAKQRPAIFPKRKAN